MDSTGSRQNSSIAALRRFVRKRAPLERCELCSAELAPEHQHLIAPSNRQLVCSCDACAILFSGASDLKYKRVPRRIRSLPDFQMTDAQWESLMIPIDMAFFYFSTPAERVLAFYPSPAGPTESLLGLESWADIVEANPILKEIESDTEALLVSRLGGARGRSNEYYIAPIDECYKLVGLIRANWRGLSGGTEVWEEIGKFFESLKQRSSPVGKEARA